MGICGAVRTERAFKIALAFTGALVMSGEVQDVAAQTTVVPFIIEVQTTPSKIGRGGWNALGGRTNCPGPGGRTALVQPTYAS